MGRRVSRGIGPPAERTVSEEASEVVLQLAADLSERRLCREGEKSPGGHEVGHGRHAYRQVVIEAGPSPTLVLVQADLLLGVLVVALDAPSMLRGPRQLLEGRLGGHARQEVVRGARVTLGPLHEKPPLRPGRPAHVGAASRAHANGGETRRSWTLLPRSQSDESPNGLIEFGGERPDLDRLVLARKPPLLRPAHLPRRRACEASLS